MKKFFNTEKILSDKLSNAEISSYAMIVGFKDDEQIFAHNADIDSYFDAASMGKVFPTSILALKAVDCGKLKLDDTLEKFFPNVSQDKKDITVKQLMTHTSGLLRHEFPKGISDGGREGISNFIFGFPIDYKPGTHFAYCCTAMTLLGFIVEKIYGEDLNSAMQEHICKPLGISRSRFNIAPNEPNAIKCNHKAEIMDIRWDDNNIAMMNGIPSGSGGLFVTARDLQTLTKALMRRDERLYGKATFDISEQNYTKNLPVLDSARSTANYALGFLYVTEEYDQACELFPTGSLGHTGWTGQSFFFNRDLNLYVILLTDATRCNSKKNGLNRVNDDEIHQMRADIHRAIKKDLEL